MGWIVPCFDDYAEKCEGSGVREKVTSFPPKKRELKQNNTGCNVANVVDDVERKEKRRRRWMRNVVAVEVG